MATYSFALRQVFNNQQVRNVLNYHSSNESILALQDEVDFFRSAWVASDILLNMSDSWSMDGVDVRDIEEGGPIVPYFFDDGPLVGSNNNAETTATQTALLISWQARAGVPPTRGRTYLTGFTSATLVQGGVWLPEAVTRAQDLADSLIQPQLPGPDDMFLRIVSMGPGGILVRDNPVDTGIARSNPATQRKRRLGTGS